MGEVGKGRFRYCNPNVHPSILPFNSITGRNPDNEFTKIWSLLYQSFFCLSDNAIEYVNKEYERIITPDMRVLGVFLRGTDYTARQPKGHPIQPDVKDVISVVAKVMPEWECEYIFLTTEERRILEHFEEAFPGRILTVNQEYYDELDVDWSVNYISNIELSRENDAYWRDLQYLSSVVILSRCTSAVLSVAGGSIGALYMNNGKYENTHIFDIGIY